MRDAYIHRDPARLTPEQIAELEEHDARFAEDQAPDRMLDAPSARTTASQRSRALFAAARDEGLSIADAAEAAGVHAATGRKYEKYRREAEADDAR